MPEWLPPNLGEWTAGTLLLLVVWMILTDRLVTRGRLNEAREETSLWRANAEAQQLINQENSQTARANAKSLAEHAEAALLQQKIMQAIQQKHLEGGGGE